MKTYLRYASLSLILFSTVAQSQGRMVEFPIPCIGIVTLSEVLTKHKETPAMIMNSSREVGGKVFDNPTVLFINYETKTWTIAEQITKDTYCVIGMGDAIKPYTDK